VTLKRKTEKKPESFFATELTNFSDITGNVRKKRKRMGGDLKVRKLNGEWRNQRL
jgi:hypothetical protein